MRSTRKEPRRSGRSRKKSGGGKRAPLGLGRKIILVLCMIIFIGSAGVLLDYYVNGAKEENALNALTDLKLGGEDLKTDKGIVVAEYAELYKANNDIIGWIKIKGTKINYPVMQTPHENEYYIHRGFDKETTSAGTPFLDAASDIFVPSSNFMIYGHNMRNGTMFHDLLKYESKEFYNEHKTIEFDTIYKGGQGKYKVIAACYSEIYPKDANVFKYYHYPAIYTESDFNEFVRGAKAESIYDTGVSTKYGDQLITLSTCAYHKEDGRFYVVAKRIK